MDRIGQQVVGIGLLDHLAGVHHRDAVRDLRDKSEVVAHKHEREAELLAQFVEQVDDLGLDRDVEGRGRLVGDDELRVAGQCHRDENALALATRQLVRVALERAIGVEPHELEQFERGACAAALNQLVELGADQHRGVKRAERVLVDHRELVTAQRVALALAHREQVLAVVPDLAVDDRAAVEQAHDREARDRFSTPRLPD